VLSFVAVSLLIATAFCYFPTMAKVETKFSVQDATAVASGISKFSSALFQEVAKTAGPTENVFISPFSVAAVTSMALAGAKGNTAEQLKTSLNLAGIDDVKINSVMGNLMSSMKGDENYTLDAANQMYVADNYQLVSHFQSTMKEVFGAEAQSVNFGDEATRVMINKWVEDYTHQKIKDLLPSGSLTPLTKLALVNAVYFKGKWLNQFDADSTKVEPFYLGSSEKKIDVPMMHHEANFRHGYLEHLDARVLEMPYEGRKLSMFIILPNKVDGLTELESKLTSENVLDTLNKHVRMPSKIQVTIPKFKVEASVDLNENLKALGMSDLFDEKNADLSGISGKKDLFVSNVFHKTFIEVNEEGSEAAAATAAVMRMKRSLDFNEDEPFVTDRPCLWALRHEPSQLWLFVGRLAQPDSLPGPSPSVRDEL